MIRHLVFSVSIAAAAVAAAVEINHQAPRVGAWGNFGMDLKTGPGEMDAFSYGFRTPLSGPIPLGRHGLMSVGLGYEGTRLDFSGTAPGFPLADMDLHEISLQLFARWRREGSPWSCTLGLTPGLATDFDHFDGDDFFLGGRIVLDYRFSDTFKAGIGAAVIRSLGRDALLPAAGFEWRPAEAWLVELAGPYFNIWWQPADDWLVRLGGGPAGGVWNINWNHLSRDLSFSSMVAGVGAEYRLAESLRLTAGIGMSFSNRLELTTTGGLTTYKTGLDHGLHVNLGLRIDSW